MSLLHSEYDFKHLLTRPTNTLDRLLKTAHKNREKKKAWDMWLTKYPTMTKDNFISFDEFYKAVTAPIKTSSQNESVQDTFNKFKNMLRKDDRNA